MIAAVIPARDEARRVAGAIAALRGEGVGRILVVANGCTDTTAQRAAEAGAEVILRGVLRGGVGEARAIGCADALGRWPDTEMLISTDADGRVGSGCIAALGRALERADAAMGRLVPDTGELAALPRHVARLGGLRDRREDLLAELASLSVARPHDPAPRHLHRAGGLMAFRRKAYLGVGGFRPMRCDEDRDIATRLSRAGYKAAHPRDAVVTVSCRSSGRAPGGMAASIAARLEGEDLAAIEMLEIQCRRLARLVARMHRNRPEASGCLADLVRGAAPPPAARGDRQAASAPGGGSKAAPSP